MKSFVAALKKYLTYMAFGALAGVAIASWVGPTFLSWYSTPPTIPGSPPPAFTCDGQIQWALTRLSQAIAISAIGFGIVFAVGGAVIGKMRAKPADPAGPTAAPPDAAPKA